MEQAYAEDTVAEPQILDPVEKISDLKGKLYIQGVQSRLKATKILTPEQRKRGSATIPAINSRNVLRPKDCG
jgi:Spy/CpxP family protein refolding chaperone